MKMFTDTAQSSRGATLLEYSVILLAITFSALPSLTKLRASAHLVLEQTSAAFAPQYQGFDGGSEAGQILAPPHYGLQHPRTN